MIKSVIFDMDGLMVNSRPLWITANSMTLANYGVNVDHRFLLPQIAGRNATDVMNIFKKTFGIDAEPQQMSNFRNQLMLQLVDEKGIEVLPGLEQIINIIGELNLKKAVATSTDRLLAMKILERTNMFDHFDTIVTGESIKNGKPAPDIFLAAAKRLGTFPEDCLVLEDAISGIDAACAAGMKSIAVPSLGTPEDFAKADLVVESLLEIDLVTLRSL